MMWTPAVCTKDCPDTCGLLVNVENGKITKVKGDPDHPFTQGFICKKATYFPEHVHNEKRILTPLKRTGPKGSGRFTPISWDNALDLITDKIKRVIMDHGRESILPYFYAGHMGIVHRNIGLAFFHKLGATKLLRTICAPAAAAGYETTLGPGPGTEIETAVDSDFIIIWGSNTLTTNLHAWPFFNTARQKGGRIVVIDPYCNRTAKQADLHIMLRPGTDAALALGMMHVLIHENLINNAYINQHTLGYDKLVPRVNEFPPGRVAEICGIAEQQIIDLARFYGKARAPYIRCGCGPARQLHGAMAMRTITCLPGLVGAFKAKGGGIARGMGGGPSDITRLTRPDLCPANTRTVNMVELGSALTRLDNPPVKLFYNYMSNPAAVAPSSAQVNQGLSRDDLFTVVHELYMTDTALMADIILPSASFLEMTDLYAAYGHNYLRIGRAVIPPVGQSMSNLAIFQHLAQRMGFKDEVFQLNEDDFIQGFLSDDAPCMKGIDLKALQQGNAVRLNIEANPYAHGFNTPSGKVEFFSTDWERKGLDPLPSGHVARDPEGGDTYPMELITPPHLLFLNSAFNEIDDIRKMAGPAEVLIHPEDAAKRGIQPSDVVRVFNARGECHLHARVTPDTQPGLLVAEGLHWPQLMPGGKGANQLTSQRLTDQGETCAFHCNRADIERVKA